MRSFDRDAAILQSIPGPLVRTLSDVDYGRGVEGLQVARMPGLLQQLALRARVASIKASSALEGVVVEDEQRADRILGAAATRLRGRSEQELVGYRDASDYVWQHDWRPLNVGLLLHLHRLLFGHTLVAGGSFKAQDNLVVDRFPDGRQQVRFRPVQARRTAWASRELIERYLGQQQARQRHPLLLVGLFVLDLLVIHPFEDGNGRVARILTNALMADAGYGVTRYISLEQLVADSAETYYASLLASTHGWHEGEHDPWPWLEYFVERVRAAYDLFARPAASDPTGGGKRDWVRRYVLEQAPATFRISGIRTALPGISDGTIRNALDDLRRDGLVEVDGTGRGASWSRR